MPQNNAMNGLLLRQRRCELLRLVWELRRPAHQTSIWHWARRRSPAVVQGLSLLRQTGVVAHIVDIIT